jgi:hypothetical protein
VEAASLPVNLPSIDEEEKAKSHSTVSTPDKLITSLKVSASNKSEETQKIPQVIAKTKSTHRRGRDERAKKAFKEA